MSSSSSSDLEVLVSQQAITLVPDEDAEAWVVGREFLGREWLYQVQLDDRRLRLRLPLELDYSRGQRCQLQLRSGEQGRLYPSGAALIAR